MLHLLAIGIPIPALPGPLRDIVETIVATRDGFEIVVVTFTALGHGTVHVVHHVRRRRERKRRYHHSYTRRLHEDRHTEIDL